MDSAARAQEVSIQKNPAENQGRIALHALRRIALHEGDSRTASTSKCTPSQQKGQQHFLVIAGLPFMKKNVTVSAEDQSLVIVHVPMPQIWEQGSKKKVAPASSFTKKMCIYIYMCSRVNKWANLIGLC